MSRTQKYIGKIKKVDVLEDETFDQVCLRLWLAEGEEEEDYDRGILFDEYYNKYFRVNNVVWMYIERTEVEADESYCNLTHNEDGTISFETRFWNGGTCESEMIENELKNIKL